MNVQQMSFDIVPVKLAIEAMRDNGYKSTAHAIAELIDNSIQANAQTVELICIEEGVKVEERRSQRVARIAVLDDGDGMSPMILRQALQFGNGTHLDDRTGIGRFGMGLPAASLSQCGRVDVWTWQTGPDNAMRAHLDLTAIRDGNLDEVPEPTPSPLPDEWRKLCEQRLTASGTLVVWSDLDKVSWRRARATLENVEFLIGRIYRKLIYDKGVMIRLVAVRNDEVEWAHYVRPNDPLYLVAPSLTPPPFQSKPMFRPWGQSGEHTFAIPYRGENHVVTLRLSWATDEARLPEDGTDAGSKDYGKQARKNIGLSIVRADRELDLDESWASDSFRDRWWGAEIDFPPTLDEVFGVTNNKQAAVNLSEISAIFMDETRVDEWMEMRELWEMENDPRLYLIDIANYLAGQIRNIRLELRRQTEGRRSKPQRHDRPTVEDKVSTKIKKRIESGKTAGAVDAKVDKETVRRQVTEDLEKHGISSERARKIAGAVVARDWKIIFAEERQDSDAFFFPRPLDGITEVVFNLSHPVYEHLVEVLDPDVLEDDAESLASRLQSASDTLKVILCAWVRYELEEKVGPRRSRVEMARREWGKMAHLFLEDDLEF